MDWSLWGITVSPETLKNLVRVGVIVVLGIPVVIVVGRRIRKYFALHLSSHHAMILGKSSTYLGMTILGLVIMRQLGFELSSLMGAAGILGIAVGFASQTSASNLISGFFLMAERPFQVGDVVQVGSQTGEILSVDALSVKLRTFDNKFVRIPNETMIKNEVANITRFPIRRIDLDVGVAYKEDIARVREILIDIAQTNPHCLQEPEPLVVMKGFGASSIDILFAVWVVKERFLKTKNELVQSIKERFDQAGVEIPFPHLSLYRGEATEPFLVQIVQPLDGTAPKRPDTASGGAEATLS